MLLSILGEAYANFTESLSTKTTLKHYLFCIEVFRNTRNLDDIISQDQDTNNAFNQVRKFLASLMERGLCQGSIINYRHVLKHFYDMNDIILNWKKIAKFSRREEVRKKDRAYTREEIQKMLDVSDLKSRVIILLFASSFVRLGGIAGLKVGNLTKINDLYQVTVYAGSNDEYTTFCTPECTKAIDSYLESRIRCGEIISAESPLFRRKFDTDDELKARNNVKAIGIDGISFLVKQAIIKSGIHAQVKGQVKRNHGFRKWGDTAMIRKAVNIVDKETLLGHGTGLDDKYYRPTDAELLEEYQKAVENLTINEENRLKVKLEREHNEIENLKEEMQSQRQSFEEFKQENRHIISEAMAKYTAQLSPKALARFRKPIKELLEEG